MSNDPWAAAASGQAAQSVEQRNPLPFDEDNLFANPSDFTGGDFTPTPPLESLIGRTLVYIPRTFDPAAPDPLKPGSTRKLWTCDLHVIDGGELRFWYKRKGDANANPPREEAVVEHVVENITPATPFVVTNMWVPQAAFVSKLTKASDARQFLVCTPGRGAMKSQRDAGQTDAQVNAAFEAWAARGKVGPEAKFVWLAADVSADAMGRVREWWTANKESIKL